jgi:hypothetical protein
MSELMHTALSQTLLEASSGALVLPHRQRVVSGFARQLC